MKLKNRKSADKSWNLGHQNWRQDDKHSRTEYEQDRRRASKCNSEAPSFKNWCCGRTISIIYPECVSEALVMRIVKRMRHIVTCDLAAIQYFSRLSHNRHHYRKTLLNIKYVLWFSLHIFFWNIPHSKEKWARYHIQGVPGGMCETSGEYSLCCTIPI